jgi:hypothetical protein
MFLISFLFPFFAGDEIAHCGLDNRGFGARFLSGKSNVYVFQEFQIGSGTIQASYPMRTGVCFSECKAAGW